MDKGVNTMSHREQIMQLHRQLATGSPQDMQVAKRLLYLLRKGRITLGLGDVEWEVENLLEGLGVRMRYSRNGNTVQARI